MVCNGTMTVVFGPRLPSLPHHQRAAAHINNEPQAVCLRCRRNALNIRQKLQLTVGVKRDSFVQKVPLDFRPLALLHYNDKLVSLRLGQPYVLRLVVPPSSAPFPPSTSYL